MISWAVINISIGTIGANWSKLEFPNNVRFTGILKHDEVQKYYLSADFFLFPSLSEGSATVAHEAFAHGLPAIVSSRSGSHYVDKLTGFTFDPLENDAESNLLGLIESLVEDSNIYQQFQANIYDQIINYSYENYVKKLDSTFCC